MKPPTVNKLGHNRYQVLKDPSEITASQRSNASRHSSNPLILGSVLKQEYTSYPHGKPVTRVLWLSRTKGNLPVGKGFKTLGLAVAALTDGTKPSYNRTFKHNVKRRGQ